MTGYFIQKVSTRKKEVLTMNSQDIVIYIFIGIAIIGLVYFAWISRKKQDSSEEFKKHKNNQADL
jgi:FtsZ-interacting cell division protein ZipA